MDERAIDVVAFDVNETLFSLASLGSAFESVGLDAGSVPLWFARLLRDGFALTAAGEHHAFAEVAADALLSLAPESLGDAEVSAVLGAFRSLDPHPDVRPAFSRLREARVRCVTLTNGSAEVTGALLARSGLESYVEATLSVDEVRRWKPAPEPYRWAAETCGVPVSRVALVAAHAWDCDGARRAGLRTGWVSRLERRRSSIFLEPDVRGDDLVQVVDRLLELPADAAVL